MFKFLEQELYFDQYLLSFDKCYKILNIFTVAQLRPLSNLLSTI